MRVIIVDDEINARKTLRLLLARISKDIKVVEEFDSVEDAVNSIPNIAFDLLLLDIELLDGTGFDILSQLPNIEAEVVFTTAYESYAIRAIKENALDYLLKPIDLEELKLTVERCRKSVPRSFDYSQLLKQIRGDMGVERIALHGVNQVDFITVEDIVYVKSDGSYAIFHMRNGEVVVSTKSLKHFCETLKNSGMIRISRSEIVNYRLISQYKKNVGHGLLIMANGIELNISRRRKTDFNAEIDKLSSQDLI